MLRYQEESNSISSTPVTRSPTRTLDSLFNRSLFSVNRSLCSRELTGPSCWFLTIVPASNRSIFRSSRSVRSAWSDGQVSFRDRPFVDSFELFDSFATFDSKKDKSMLQCDAIGSEHFFSDVVSEHVIQGRRQHY